MPESQIIVRLNFDYADSSLIDREFDKKIFSLSPKIEGHTKWIDSRTVVFKPNQNFKQGQVYKVKFYLHKLIKVPKFLKTFEFSVRVDKQDFEIFLDDIQFYSEKDLNYNFLTGKIFTHFPEKLENIRKIFKKIQYDGKSLNITITKVKDKEFDFRIDSILRKNTAQKLEIYYNGAEIGVDKKGQKLYEIAPSTHFMMINRVFEYTPNKRVKLVFNLPIDKKQNINSKISIRDEITEKDISYKYEIDKNFLYLFCPERDEIDVTIDSSLRSVDGKFLISSYKVKFQATEILPSVKFVSSGGILPTSNDDKIAIEAINVKYIDLKVTKIYSNNIKQFLQINNFLTKKEVARFGKVVLDKTIKLADSIPRNKWVKYFLDLSTYLSMDRGCIYSVQIKLKPEYSIFTCPDFEVKDFESQNRATEDFDISQIGTQGDLSDDDYYEYYYSINDDICSKLKYFVYSVNRNILSTDIGIMAKVSENKEITVLASNIINAEPIANADVEIYDFQMQLIQKGKTDKNGFYSDKLKALPYIVYVQKSNDRCYLVLNTDNYLSTSEFDVSGEVIKDGKQGFIYTDRGVWRPGDSIFVTLILKNEQLTELNHPIIFELYNPLGTLIEKRVVNEHFNNFYVQKFKTTEETPTGNYLLKVYAGAKVLEKTLKIEAFKPNRLEIEVVSPDKIIKSTDQRPITIKAKWLSGAVCSNYDYEIYYSLRSVKTTFQNYEQFNFDNILNRKNTELSPLKSGNLDADGMAYIYPNILVENAPGFVNINLETRVFEPTGEYSTDISNFIYSPFKSYVGIKPPSNKDYSYLFTDSIYTFEVINLTEYGKPIANSTVNVKIFKKDYSQWWYFHEDELDYLFEDDIKYIFDKKVKIVNGKGSFTFKVNNEDWGTYVIMVKDLNSGHLCAIKQYFDWFGYDRDRNENVAAVTLDFSLDKQEYKIGEDVRLYAKVPENSEILITVENGTKILHKEVVKVKEGEISYSFKATEQMLPNSYVFVSALQPHKNTKNGLPIRLYGVKKFIVVDESKKLKPKIICNDQFRPNSDNTITVKEENGKSFTYTLAVVDEGLLNITKFKTPQPYDRFYSQIALGVKTWDIYSQVIGTYEGIFAKLISLGGDEASEGSTGVLKANRFKPFVIFLGPFELKEKSQNVHKIKIPNYIGKARIMVVAANVKQNSYGNAEKSVEIKSPFVIYLTAPRVISIKEKFYCGVSLLCYDLAYKNVSVSIKTNELLIAEKTQQNITFTTKGEKWMFFPFKSTDKTGVGRITITANSGNETIFSEIELDVRIPNPPVIKDTLFVLPKNGTLTITSLPEGIKGTNTNILEISSFLPLNLTKWLKFVFNYPHGCTEQTVSSVYALIFNKELSTKFESVANTKKINEKIKNTIKKLETWQKYDGSFTMWPSSNYADYWITTYAGLFLYEAKQKGFALNEVLVNRWLLYQRNQARLWKYSKNNYNDDFIQAFRLYSLAVAGEPDFSAMNYLLENKNLYEQSYWLLANAFARAGRLDLAQNVVKLLSDNVQMSKNPLTYGSDIRDLAFKLEYFVLTNQHQKSLEILKQITELMNNSDYLSTQEISFLVRSIAMFLSKNPLSSSISFEIKKDNKVQKIETNDLSYTLELEKDKKDVIVLTNKSNGKLYVRLIKKFVPEPQKIESFSKNISIDVHYIDVDGKPIDIDKLKQGTVFYSFIKVQNNGMLGDYHSLALTQIVPSGWEILSDKFDDNYLFTKGLEYRDIRDDRVHYYFSLPENSSIILKTRLIATYKGSFYLPGIYCEAMYRPDIKAFLKGKYVNVE